MPPDLVTGRLSSWLLHAISLFKWRVCGERALCQFFVKSQMAAGKLRGAKLASWKSFGKLRTNSFISEAYACCKGVCVYSKIFSPL